MFIFINCRQRLMLVDVLFVAFMINNNYSSYHVMVRKWKEVE